MVFEERKRIVYCELHKAVRRAGIGVPCSVFSHWTPADNSRNWCALLAVRRALPAMLSFLSVDTC